MCTLLLPIIIIPPGHDTTINHPVERVVTLRTPIRISVIIGGRNDARLSVMLALCRGVLGVTKS